MASDYQVLSQSQSTELNQAGSGFQDVWNISYKVLTGPSKGTVASITVPDSEHDAATVKSMIEDKIQTLNAVANLGSS
jgi:hypothetical protein